MAGCGLEETQTTDKIFNRVTRSRGIRSRIRTTLPIMLTQIRVVRARSGMIGVTPAVVAMAGGGGAGVQNMVAAIERMKVVGCEGASRLPRRIGI